MNAPSLVAVAEHVPCAGGIVWWRLSGDVMLDELRAEWTARGLPDGLLPTPPGPQAALTRAVAAHRSKRTLARPLANRAGHALVHERLSVDDDLEYSTGLRVKLDGLGRPAFEPTTHPLVPDIRRSYERHLDTLSTHDIGAWLVRLVLHVDGIRLKDTGGVYFVPYQRVAEWGAMTQAIHATSAHRVNEVPALRAEDAVNSILDALSAEASTVADALESELASGLTPRVAGNRVRRCELTVAKVSRYETLLGAKADDLHARLEALRAQLCVAAITEDGDDLSKL